MQDLTLESALRLAPAEPQCVFWLGPLTTDSFPGSTRQPLLAPWRGSAAAPWSVSHARRSGFLQAPPTSGPQGTGLDLKPNPRHAIAHQQKGDQGRELGQRRTGRGLRAEYERRDGDRDSDRERHKNIVSQKELRQRAVGGPAGLRARVARQATGGLAQSQEARSVCAGGVQNDRPHELRDCTVDPGGDRGPALCAGESDKDTVPAAGSGTPGNNASRGQKAQAKSRLSSDRP